VAPGEGSLIFLGTTTFILKGISLKNDMMVVAVRTDNNPINTLDQLSAPLQL
jgi:uncharacterized 2Fe-2S/4Fe-4S cluster protein (DUF4445 family)